MAPAQSKPAKATEKKKQEGQGSQVEQGGDNRQSREGCASPSCCVQEEGSRISIFNYGIFSFSPFEETQC